MSQYDNPNTIQYKFAKSQGIPISYLVLVNDPGTGSNEIRSLPQILPVYLAAGLSVIDIFNALKVLNSNLDVGVFVHCLVSLDPDLEKPDKLEEVSKRYIPIISQLYRSQDILKRMDSVSDFVFTLNDVKEKFTTNLNIDIKRANEIENSQSRLTQAVHGGKRFYKTNVNVNAAALLFKTKIKNEEHGPISPKLGRTIFDSIILSQNVPFAQYNDADNESVYGVYKGEKLGVEPKYKNITFPKESTQKGNTIYVTLWLAKSGEDFYTSSKDSFHLAALNLDDGSLTVSTPFLTQGSKDENSQITHKKLSEAIPSISIGPAEETRVRVDTMFIPRYPSTYAYNDYPMNIQLPSDIASGDQFDVLEHIFLDLAMNDLTFSRHIYCEETVKPFALKKRFDLHYRPSFSDTNESNTPISNAYISNSATVTFTLSVRKAKTNETVQLRGIQQLTQLSSGYQYIHINITRADSREAADEFLRVFEGLLSLYWDTVNDMLSNPNNIMRIYPILIPDLYSMYTLKKSAKGDEEGEQSVRQAKIKRGDALTKLQEHHPTVFRDSYVEDCAYYPFIVPTAEEAEAWTAGTISIKGEDVKRKYIQYPPPAPFGKTAAILPSIQPFFVVCGSSAAPFPGVVPNSDKNTNQIFPYVPCCFTRDQQEDLTTDYSKYYKGIYQEKKETTYNRLRSNQLLEPGRMGYLPESIITVLKQHGGSGGDFVRYGVPRSYSSLLHCVMRAANDTNYFMTKEAQREDYVRSVRAIIAKQIDAGALRQELYDMSDEEIRKNLADPELPMDPSLFYRALEELYNVNIYVFTLKKSKGVEEGDIEIPRYRYFHIRPSRLNRQTIIIYKHMGSESNRLRYHQCDLIVDLPESGSIKYFIFDAEMAQICHAVLERAIKTLSMEDPTAPIVTNAYDTNYPAIINAKIYSQYIDGNGKMRAITFKESSGSYISLSLPPSQPISAPVSIETVSADVGTVLRILPNPTAVSIDDKTGSISGLWYQSTSSTTGLYVKIDQKSLPSLLPSVLQTLKSLPNGPRDPLTIFPDNSINRLKVLRRKLSYIKQLCIWIFDTYRASVRNGATEPNTVAYEFASKYFKMDANPVRDSASYYDFSLLTTSLLPQAQGLTLLNAFEFLHTKVPSLVAKNQGGYEIMMYNADFASKMYDYISTYFLNTIDRRMTPAEEIVDYYQSYTDYMPKKNSEIFTSDRDISIWIDSRKSDIMNQFKVQTRLDSRDGIIIDPIIFKSSDSKLYIIQNPISGKLGSAAAIAATWRDKKYNPGSDVKSLKQSDLVSLIIYSINIAGDLTVMEDRTGGNKSYVKIIFYGTEENRISERGGRYGALLEL